MKLTRLFTDFFNSERASGLVLIACTVVSLSLTNLYVPYHDFWHIEIGHHSLTHWINDGLMAIFFLLIGLELEREVYIGELSDFRQAALPIAAAFGGMVFPAAIYYLINFDGNTRGVGVPMATDIAFALGALSLLGSRVPVSLKIFVTALAVIDDLGAILVIAFFYTNNIDWVSLGIAFGIFAVLLVFNRIKIRNLIPYLVLGVAMWYFMLNSGIHATISGVLLAFAIPFGNGDERSTSWVLQHALHKPVAFIILPIFALANTSIVFQEGMLQQLGGAVSLGIMAGLFIGKPLGIFLTSFVGVRLRLFSLPSDIQWKHILGAGILGGIGFTMSIFISILAFEDASVVDGSKISVMIISLVAGVIGFLVLKKTLPERPSV